MQTRKWQDQNGQDKYTTEIVGNEMQMLGGRGGDAGARPQGGGFRSNQPAQQAQPQAQSQAQPQTDPGFADDDIPF